MKKLLYLAIVLLFQAGICLAQGPMPHVLDKASALALARAQGKFVLVVQGTPTCGNCIQFENYSLTATSSEAPIKYLLDEAFVYWYCNSFNDTTAACNTEIRSYSKGLSDGYGLPLVAIIDPTSPESYLWRMTGPPNESYFFQTLNATLIQQEGPILSNLKDGDTIHDANFVVQGQSRWNNLCFRKVGVKVNSNSWTSVTASREESSPNQALNPLTWSYQLSEAQLVKGKNTIEVRIDSSLLCRAPTSPTRRITFTYEGQ